LPKFKEEQLNFRQAEIEETIKVLRSINEGHGADVFHSNRRHEGRQLEHWADCLDFEQLTVGGHSFGATGALQALKGSPSGSIPARGGIILDPGKSSGPLNHDIDVPILVIHSNSWSSKHSIFFGRPHFETVKELVDGVLSRTGASWFLTSLGTSHPSVTDAPLIEPVLLSWTTGATIDVREGVHQYVSVSKAFLDFLKSGRRRGILAEEVTHPQYGQDGRDDKRKKEMPKYIAKYWQIHVAPSAK
jgi:platelet-activating factor acetylhydrolase